MTSFAGIGASVFPTSPRLRRHGLAISDRIIGIPDKRIGWRDKAIGKPDNVIGWADIRIGIPDNLSSAIA